jgi:hypothetical protein
VRDNLYGTFWWDAEEGEVCHKVLPYVNEVERVQSSIYDRFVKLAALYDPYDVTSTSTTGNPWTGPDSNVSENVIAANVDTVTAIVAATEVRARVMTDDGDWSTQRTARHLEWYAEGLGKLLDIHTTAIRCFKDAALKGTGLAKVYYDSDCYEIRVERVMVDDIIVDEAECRSGKPRQMHQRVFVDREVLKTKFPEHEDAIHRAQSDGGEAIGNSSWRVWASYRPIEHNEVVVIESWRLPIGKKGEKGYKPGRHTICIDGADLLDEKWEKPFFPFARMAWSERTTGWYACGLAERIAGHQRALNKLNWQIDRQLDQHAVPTTYVRLADANLAVKATNRLGTIAVYKGEIPKTVIPPAVSGETYQRQATLKEGAFEESGLSRLAATAKKPGGLDSGVALREYRDQTTQRFAQQEKAFERFILDIIWLALDCAKDLGEKAPVVIRKSKYGVKKITWADVDMTEVRVQLAAASNLSRTPAGRLQLALEWAQAGVITMDEFRRLSRHPDLERTWSLYTAAMEDIERCIEEILDGEVLVPEPYQNLKMGQWRMQMSYLKARDDGAPEEILENLRQWIVQATHILTPPPTMTPAPVPGATDVAAAPGLMTDVPQVATENPAATAALPALAPQAIA